ncbi:helix-turn-helix domain-containing protein [Streptococcus moroccensis]|uniref:Cytoskeletal protein RodZ n=1 Tax=Streptococcus moroccensis TaxID=1451356 RepID=A0ABT9YT75_9STRE|nr:helix-turn-helix domain-containing protein [Streptococcus moroccensis]MDQ0222558.1 cytoskeletal protein RodZ [Streptococcus moroccensis]
MAEKTIGQVFRAAREDLNLSVSDAYHALKTHRRYIRALEDDAFDLIPGQGQARKLVARYAEFLDLDVKVLLNAYDTNSPLMVYEVGPKDSRYKRSFQKQRKQRSKRSIIPFITLLFLSLMILCSAIYMIWDFQSSQNQTDKSVSFQVSQSASSEGLDEATISSSTEEVTEAPEQPQLDIIVTPAENPSVVEVNQAPDELELTLSVKHSESWVAVSGTSLAGGTTLSADQESVTVSINKIEIPSVQVSLGVVEGLSLTINGQAVDLSGLSQQPAMLTLYFK